MATKPRIPKMTKARQALFDKYGVDAKTAKRYHVELSTKLKPLMRLFDLSTSPGLKELFESKGEKTIVFGSDDEANGNMIIVAHYERVQRVKDGKGCSEMDGLTHHVEMRDKYNQPFFRTFGVPLRKYWIDNREGFDVLKFDDEVVKSGNRSCGDVVEEKWGKEARQIIEGLLSSPKAPETLATPTAAV